MGKKRNGRRRSATRVKNGKVLPKNHWLKNTWELRESSAPTEIERERAGRGWRHLLNRSHVERFIGLIDDWDQLTEGLSTVRLATGSWGFGYATGTVVAVRAFPKDLEISVFVFDAFARRVLSILDVPVHDGCYVFDENKARAWQLLDVFVHELGHFVDARTNRTLRPQRGEAFAIRFSAERLPVLWPKYQRAFEI